jgi:uncharacterized membrane protein YiaA
MHFITSLLALLIGSITFSIGIWNAGMPLNEKGFYFPILMYGLFAALAVQKNIRDLRLAQLIEEKNSP